MNPTTTEPTARLSSGRIVTESEVRAVLERAGLSYPLPPARAAIEATQGAAHAIPASGHLDTGRGAGLTPAPCAGEGDAKTLTMADHLAIHPEDEVCPACYADPEVQAGCRRCGGDGRRGEDCPACDGDGWTYRLGLCRAPGCRLGRMVEETTR